jgi:hypothetical protein
MSLDKRVEKNITSIKNLKELLINVIKNSQNYTEDFELLDSLTSQGKLAKYENINLNIYQTSINTMKRLSDYPDCDFESLNKLRVAALDKLQKKEEVQKDKTTYNKKDLEQKVEELEGELALNRNSQMVLLKTIYEMNNTIKAVRNVNSIEEVKEHLNLISNKIKQLISLDSSFIANESISNVISHDFKKKV